MATTEQVGTGRLTSDVFVSGRRRDPSAKMTVLAVDCPGICEP